MVSMIGSIHEPADPAERALWREARWGAVVLLCGLANDDPALLRRAVTEWADPLTKVLVLDAAALAGIEDQNPSRGG
jgi:hypothetical protein